MTTPTKPSRLREAILETAEGMHRAGIMNDATFRKITVRQLGPDAPPTADRRAVKTSAMCASRRI